MRTSVTLRWRQFSYVDVFFLDQDYPTTGFPSFFTLEISVFLEFVQMVFHTTRSQIKDRSQSLTGQVLILGEQVQNLLGSLTDGLLGSGKLLLGSVFRPPSPIRWNR